MSANILLFFLLLSAHSMEEAEVLCDRIGIFVDGNLQCIGGPKQVTTPHVNISNSDKYLHLEEHEVKLFVRNFMERQFIFKGELSK